MVQGDETMRYVKACSLDAHDRKRFNELLPDVNPDSVIATEFDDAIEKLAARVRRIRIVAGPVPVLAVGDRARTYERKRA
jgi:hypothetical protein